MRWMRPDGAAMTAADWADPEGKSIAMVVAGTLEADLDDEGAPMVDDDLAVLINAWWEPETFTLPWPGGAPAVIESDSDDPSRGQGRRIAPGWSAVGGAVALRLSAPLLARGGRFLLP